MDYIRPVDLERAIEDLNMLKFFPHEAGTQAAIMRLLAKICPHREALEWLVGRLVTKVGEWPGPAELRGILCTKYPPADGEEGYSSLPGFTPEDSESAVIEQHQQINAGGWDEHAERRLGPGVVQMLKRLTDGKVM